MKRIGALVVLVLAGLLFSTSARTSGGDDLRREQRTLPGLIRAEEQRVSERVAAVEALRSQVEQLSGAVGEGDARVAQLQEQMAPLEQQAGLSSRSGRGLVVEMTDAPRDRPVPEGVPLDFLVVHQQDVQSVVNALWRGGATAMQLQDQRVITTTAFRCIGNTMVLHGRTYSPPYRIEVLGDPRELRRALQADDAVAAYAEDAEAYGLGWEVRAVDELEVPAYDGGLDLRWARVPDAAVPERA